VVRALILVGLAVVAALAIGPALGAPELEDSDAWAGKPARSWVRADRDYRVVDQEATERAREDARARSRAVWDLDAERAERDAGALREALARARVGAADDEETARARFAGDLALLGAEAPDDESWALLLLLLTDEQPLIDDLTRELREALSRPIVGDRSLLVRAAGRGIVVRPVPLEEGRGEQVIEQVDQLLDLEEVRARTAARLEVRLGEGPGARGLATRLADLIGPTLAYNITETDLRRRRAVAGAASVVVEVRRGQVVTRPGEPLDHGKVLVLRAMQKAQGDAYRVSAALAAGAFTLLLCGVLYLFGLGAVRAETTVRGLAAAAFSVALQLFVLVIAVHLGDKSAELANVPRLVVLVGAPTSMATLLIRALAGPRLALFGAALTVVLGAVMVDSPATWIAVVSVAQVTAAAWGASRALPGALLGGVLGGFTGIAVEVFRGALPPTELGMLGVAAVVGGLLSWIIARAITTPSALLFGVATDHRLERVGDLNHPLLKELVVHAPGTWHHSVAVARLAERGAASIGARVALARAIALFHDVGKLVDPEAFDENQDEPAPPDSAAIARHVARGVELAREHRLPEIVVEGVACHHAGGRVAGTDERYVGAPPSTREAAIALLADRVERAWEGAEGVPHEVVGEVVHDAWESGALDASGLSIADLARIRESMASGLVDEGEEA
jgi:putative nucleotidyltransferase with HDIG domain